MTQRSEGLPTASLPMANDPPVMDGAAYGRVVGRLRLMFIIPLAAAILSIVAVLTVILYRHADSGVQAGVVRIRASAQDFYEESVRYDASALQAIMDTMGRDQVLRSALARRDRGVLIKHATPLFDDLKRDYTITHLYFTGPDRVNLLRAHAPLRFGDVIDRVSTLLAERGGVSAYGVELGPLGTFTLRLVEPWYERETNRLLGYVEIGMEVDRVLQKLRDFFGVDVLVLVRKEFLERDRWEEGMRALGRTPKWERFPGVVESLQSPQAVPEFLADRLVRGEQGLDSRIVELLHGGFSFRVTFLPLQDLGGRSVAQMVLIRDVSAEEDAALSIVYAGTVAAVTVGVLLLVFFYWLVGRIGRRIERDGRELERLATHDGLTGLHNQRTFYGLLDAELVRSHRYDRSLSLLMLDIDHFKRVNDTQGHLAGDAVLRGLSERVKRQVRLVDRLCRYGGEEFALILPETETDVAREIAERLCLLVAEQPFELGDGQSMPITVSIGVASFPAHAAELSMLVSVADTALYAAKAAGRNRVCVYQAKPGSAANP